MSLKKSAAKTDCLWVVFTMDVERILKFSPTGGPVSLEFAEKAVRVYGETLLAHGYPATFFMVPDAAAAQGDLFRSMIAAGHECGMHFHDQSLGYHYRHPDEYDYLGGYTAAQQRAVLLAAKKEWQKAMGFRPAAFRPGNFSANDNTFPVLAELGFTHGSVSQPGRDFNHYRANWKSACRDVHRAHPAFRHIPGDLDFVEIPVTGNPVSSLKRGWGIGDIRLENTELSMILDTVRQDIKRQIDEKVAFKHLCFFTHNFVDYWSDSTVKDSRKKRLDGLLRKLPGIAKKFGLSIKGATTRMVREAYRQE